MSQLMAIIILFISGFVATKAGKAVKEKTLIESGKGTAFILSIVTFLGVFILMLFVSSWIFKSLGLIFI